MTYIKFIFLFTIAHIISYTMAGIIALKFSKDIYEGKKRLCYFLNDMGNEKERSHVEKYFLFAQIARGILMGVVLLPILNSIQGLSFSIRVIFFSSLMFVYTHLSSASPFMDNIEGQVYFKSKYLNKKSFLKFQIEMIIYSSIFGFIITLFMNFLN